MRNLGSGWCGPKVSELKAPFPSRQARGFVRYPSLLTQALGGQGTLAALEFPLRRAGLVGFEAGDAVDNST